MPCDQFQISLSLDMSGYNFNLVTNYNLHLQNFMLVFNLYVERQIFMWYPNFNFKCSDLIGFCNYQDRLMVAGREGGVLTLALTSMTAGLPLRVPGEAR